MASWNLAPSLSQLFAELNTRWPARDRTPDGTIGDASHAARQSEHNPNRDPSDDVPDGMVTAVDVDKDGIDVEELVRALTRDARTWYVIWDRHIYSRTHAFEKRPYAGASPHTDHVHLSLMQNRKACTDTSPWGIYKPKPPAGETPFQRVSRIAAQRRRRIRNLLARLKRK